MTRRDPPCKTCFHCYRIVYIATARCPGCGLGLTFKGREKVRAEHQAAMQAACDAFNAAHPVGSTIMCWPGIIEGEPVERTIKAPGATILSGHTAVAYVSGGGGCIALSHISGV